MALARTARDSARAEGVSADLVEGVITVESAWDPRAYHYDYTGDPPPEARAAGWGAEDWGSSWGLMQLEGVTAWEALGYRGHPQGLWAVEINTRLGARYLKTLMTRYGDVLDTLIAYNGGGAAVADYHAGKHTPALAYARKVLRAMAHWGGQYAGKPQEEE